MEFTLLNIREVRVYQIPPATSNAGHKADDWKTCIWQGRARICGKGKDCLIKLMEVGSEKLFAQCTVKNGDHDKFVERTTDSSRYFVLKITNGARHAFIGLGFEDRNDAFDFNCALNDFKSTWVDRDPVPEEAPDAPAPTQDLRLKEGQKIKLNFKIGGKDDDDADKPKKKTSGYQASAAGGGGSLSAFSIAPPPGSGGVSRRPAAPAAAAPDPFAAAPVAAGKQDEFFADFDDFDFQGAAPAGGASSAPLVATGGGGAQASMGGGINGLDAQLGSLSLTGGPSPAPVATQAPVAASQPAPAFAFPQAAPAPAAAPQMATGATAAPGGFDMFDLSGLANAAGPPKGAASSGGAGAPFGVASQQTGMQTGMQTGAPGKPAKKNAFDEFDIFR